MHTEEADNVGTALDEKTVDALVEILRAGEGLRAAHAHLELTSYADNFGGAAEYERDARAVSDAAEFKAALDSYVNDAIEARLRALGLIARQ